jgi:multiple sugar transport system ATP-binding protein
MAQVILKNIQKMYPGNSNYTVKDCNIDIKDKEFIVLVGPSGCGKSTTLRMIAGLEEITGGELFIDDTVVNNVPATDRDIAMVFQNYALYPHMTAYENMAFSLKLKKFSKLNIDRKVKKAAELLDIGELLEKKPKQMSGGQRQRVALGRAIVREPKVFLMDEPLSNLDAKLRVQMRSEIAKLHNELQTTFIYVTHDQTEALTMGTRIVVMKDGDVMQVATPQKAYDAPENLFVAQFIGSPQMNIMKGILVEDGNVYAIKLSDNTLIQTSHDMTQKLKDNGYKGKEVYIGIRPEYIVEETQNIRHTHYSKISGKIDVAELIGSETYLHFQLADHLVIARVDSHLNKKVGDTVNFHFPADLIHIFDKDTEKAIR